MLPLTAVAAAASLFVSFIVPSPFATLPTPRASYPFSSSALQERKRENKVCMEEPTRTLSGVGWILEISGGPFDLLREMSFLGRERGEKKGSIWNPSGIYEWELREEMIERRSRIS